MKIAVVGSGISGLSAAWLLSKTHEVHLFESDSRLGGHAHTVDIQESGGPLPVDTGFLVYNELTYPNLCGFFDALGVKTMDSDMSLSIQVPRKNLEWSGTNLNTVFSQRRNLFRPSFYRMILEILRFAREAEMNLRMSRENRWSLGDLLREKKYSNAFLCDYLIPAGAAIWSTPEARMLEFPAETFLTFFMNHRLLEVEGRPIWRTVVGGSREYVKLAAAGITHVHVSSSVERVERSGSGVDVYVRGQKRTFDHVVMATHAPVTSRLLVDAREDVREVLSAFKTEENLAVLHDDSSTMPKRKLAWASWNVLGTYGSCEGVKATLTYYLNRLQSLRTTRDYFVTLNPIAAVKNPIREFSYAHPQFDRRAIDAQARIESIQGIDGIYLAGAWTRYGFHEDGILSAVQVAKHFGVRAPWANSETAE